ncbi:MAG: hypothetical protein ACRDLL_06660 [Solirubrobacterales bacterium]
MIFLKLSLVKALGHEIRFKLLNAIGTGTSSPTLLSREIAEPLSSVAYHVKVLVKAEILELVTTVSRRGATEHVYRIRAVAMTDLATLKAVPRGLRGHAAAPTMQSIIEGGIGALESGALDKLRPGKLNCLLLSVDDKGCEEIIAAIDALVEKCLVAHEGSAKRRKRRGDQVSVTVFSGGFESAAGPSLGPDKAPL